MRRKLPLCLLGLALAGCGPRPGPAPREIAGGSYEAAFTDSEELVLGALGPEFARALYARDGKRTSAGFALLGDGVADEVIGKVTVRVAEKLFVYPVVKAPVPGAPGEFRYIWHGPQNDLRVQTADRKALARMILEALARHAPGGARLAPERLGAYDQLPFPEKTFQAVKPLLSAGRPAVREKVLVALGALRKEFAGIAARLADTKAPEEKKAAARRDLAAFLKRNDFTDAADYNRCWLAAIKAVSCMTAMKRCELLIESLEKRDSAPAREQLKQKLAEVRAIIRGQRLTAADLRLAHKHHARVIKDLWKGAAEE